MAEAVSDLRDTRVLIPRTRRALLGPHASSSGAVANVYSDDEVNALVADAIADIILFSGGEDVFGHQLEVVTRDAFYMAPIAWQTDTPLTEAEGSLIAAQAALSHYIYQAENLKTSERIADEGQEWEYQIAASVVTERIKALREDRDRALTILQADNSVSDAYINFLSVRDQYTTALIEPWSSGLARGGQTFDPRGFLTP